MRLVRHGFLFFFLLACLSGWARQPGPSQQATPAQLNGDPQAVAVVQAAITALGGATAIGQAQSWTFQAQTAGPHSNGDVDYTISTHTDTGKLVRPDGTNVPAPPIHSHFVPALVGAILLKESQDPELTVSYAGASLLGVEPVTVVNFFFASGPGIPAQIWTFDAANLPVRIDFRTPVEIGARASFPVVVALSDYRAVSGVKYPFQIASLLPGKPPQVVSIRSITPSTTAPANQFNSSGGDLH